MKAKAHEYINKNHPYAALYDLDGPELVLLPKDRIEVKIIRLEDAIYEYIEEYGVKPTKLISRLKTLRNEVMRVPSG